MSNIQDDISNNLKLIVAEKLKTLQNFNEDVNYVAEYIVLLMSNGGTVDSVVQELTSLFDSVSVDALKQVVESAFFALGLLQSGESLQSVVSKIQNNNSSFTSDSNTAPAPAPASTATPSSAPITQPESDTSFGTAFPQQQPKSAFDGLIAIPSMPSGSLGRRGGREGGVGKFGARGGRNNDSHSSRRANALAKALGMENGGGNINITQKKEGRCKLFPRCPLGKQCPHAHPTKVCNQYPNCPNAPGTCNFLHPNEDVELMKDIEKTREEYREKKAAQRAKPVNTGIVLCKFGSLCSNPQCPFGHPTPANEDAKVLTFIWCPENLNCQNPACDKAHSSLSKIKSVKPLAALKPPRQVIEKSLEQCKFGQNCTNKRCKYRHARSHIMCREGANCTRIDCLFGHPIDEDCRFGIECKNIYCLFKHPEGRQLPEKPTGNNSGNNSNNSFNATASNTWVNPALVGGNSSSNERPFAIAEGADIETAPPQENDTVMN